MANIPVVLSLKLDSGAEIIVHHITMISGVFEKVEDKKKFCFKVLLSGGVAQEFQFESQEQANNRREAMGKAVQDYWRFVNGSSMFQSDFKLPPRNSREIITQHGIGG